jgi:M6 family metalloprotease-like protein
MKKLLAVLFSFLCLSMSANLVQNEPIEFTQPDGTVLKLFVTGDEYYHRVHDANGYTILKDARTGYAVYAVADGQTLQASQYIVGRSDPAELGLMPNLTKSKSEIESNPFGDNMTARNSGARVPPTGSFNNIVIFLRFADQTEFPAETFSAYNSKFNSTDQASLKDYYHEVSNNQLNINSYLFRSSGNNIISFQSVFPRGYYSPASQDNLIGYTDPVTMGVRIGELVAGICAAADPYIPDDINCDTNGDSQNDALTFVIRGTTDAWGDALWPYCVSLPVPSGMINGIGVYHFIFVFETSGFPGTICHEMGHNIGFPDMYHYPPDNHNPTGIWSLMSSSIGQHTTAYEKKKYGHWFSNVPEIVPSATPTQYTITAIDQNPYACYKIASHLSNQYYMLEYRRKTGRYESNLPGSGLIVYRIIESYGGEAIDGNADGPPDEVYVYRPGGSVTEEGYLNSAPLGSDTPYHYISDRTYYEPWLYLDSAIQTWGNLSIAGVGPTGGTTISFTVLGSPVNLWTGATSGYWNDAANWSQNIVPGSDTWVEIPWHFYYIYPNITSQVYCTHLTISPYAHLYMHENSILYNNGSLDVFGVLEILNDNVEMVIAGNMNFHSRSQVISSGTTNMISVQGNVLIEDSTEVDFSTVTLKFYGNGNSEIRLEDSASIYDFRSQKNSGYSTNFTGLATESLNIKGGLKVYSGSSAYCAFGGALNIYGNFTIYGGGVCHFDNGIVRMGGITAGNASLNFGDGGNYIYQLEISKATDRIVSLSSYVSVKSDLSINSGCLSAGSQSIYIGGNWTNYSGTAAFTEGTSTVVFNGSANQLCNWGETFYNMELNKAGGYLCMTSPSAIVSCTALNVVTGGIWVGSGIYTISDLLNNGIYGSWKLTSGGTVNLYNNDGYIDLNGSLDISGGNFNVYGGTDDSFWSYDGDASVTMTGGTLDFKNKGIRIYNTTDHSFTENIAGGTIRTSGSFVSERTDYHPTGGLTEFYGSSDISLNLNSGSRLASVQINKLLPARDSEAGTAQTEIDRFGRQHTIQRTSTVSCGSNLVVYGNFTIISGTFNAPALMEVYGNWTVPNSPDCFNEGSGTVSFLGTTDSYCTHENFYRLQISKTTGAAFRNVEGHAIVCGHYDWTSGTLNITNGGLAALDLDDPCICGTIICNEGYLYLFQDTAQYVDLQANITLFGGEINVYGGTDIMLWPYGGNASVTMYGGAINVHDRPVHIFNTAPTLTTNITGGSIKVAKDFSCDRSDFNLTAGSVEMYSSSDAYFNMAAGSIYNLKINKTASREDSAAALPVISRRIPFESLNTRTNSVTVLANFTCHDLTVNAGTFNSGGRNITTTGTVNINSGGVFNFGSGGTFAQGTSKYLFVNSGGTINFYGTGTVNALCTCSAGYYYLNVESGATIKADYTIFEKMGANGIQVKPGATVDPAHAFTGCTFRYGQNTGTLLLLDNEQNLCISNAVFPTNTWSGYSNVKKTVDSGCVNFANATGAYSGESYDDDPYGRLVWTAPTAAFDLYVVKAVWSTPYPLIGNTYQVKVTCLNAGTVSLSGPGVVLDMYYNQSTPPPAGAIGDAELFPTSFPAGLPVDYTFNVYEDDDGSAGQWTSWFQIDVDNNVQESSESNNIYGPLYINWVYLPPVEIVSIVRIAANNEIRLHWNPYPTFCHSFRIYRSTTPDFTPTNEYYHASVDYPNTYYFELITSTHYFYKVTASWDFERSETPPAPADR